MPLVLGVDSSTQATKVEVRDADDGTIVVSGRAPHPSATPPRSEQQPSAWWAAFVAACREAGVGPGGAEVSAVSVAAQQHGMVVLDAAGRVLRPAKLWNDTESAPDAEVLVEALPGGAAAWAAACGSVPVASFTVTKLAWMARHEPELWRDVATVLLPHDWLTMQLSGVAVTDRGDASGTGYWSPGEGAWRTDLLALVDDARDWTACLPRVLAPYEAAGEWDDAVVAPGTGDNMAAALGIGLAPGDVAVSVGTSGTVFAVSPSTTADASGAVAGFADASGRYLPLICTLNATKVTDTVARLLGVDHEAFDALALGAQPGAGGLVLVPYLDGERTPNRPDATGTFTGLRSEAEPGDVARAAVEGVLCGLLDGLDALRANGVTVDDGRMFLVGGGARSAAYRQVLADLTGREVRADHTGSVEHAAAGACVQAAAVLHGVDPVDLAAAWDLAPRTAVAPSIDPATAASVRAAYSRAATQA